MGSAQAAVETLRRGHSNRSRAETALNASSRSHSVFTVTVQRPASFKVCTAATSSVVTCKTHFVDSLIRAREARRERRQAPQGGHRDQLLAHVPREVPRDAPVEPESGAEGDAGNAQRRILPQRRVPYRESKLTHLFKSALHGWGGHAHRERLRREDYDETAHVLKSAATAAQVSTAPRLELVHPPPR